MSEAKYAEPFSLYKARKDGIGVASQFKINANKRAVFLEAAQQTEAIDKHGNAKFDWKNKVCFKLGISDIGEILAVLHNMKQGVGQLKNGNYTGLYHQTSDGDAVLNFRRKNDKNGFYMSLSVRRGDQQKKIQHSISYGEGISLSVLLRQAIEIIYNWC